MHSAPPAKKSNTLVIVLVVVGVVIFVGVAAVGMFAAFGIYGARKYLSESKQAEGRAQARVLAMGVQTCAEHNRGLAKSELLPDTSTPVPASLGEVSGKKYQSQATDWSDPAYDCAAFSIAHPQYFQYQWVRDAADRGKVVALADFDGDGSPDVRFEVPVTCSGSACSAAALVER